MMACSRSVKARVSSFASWAVAARCTSAWARAASAGVRAAGGATRGSGMAAGSVGGGILSVGMGGVSADATTGASGEGSDPESSGLAWRSGSGDSVSVWTTGVAGSGGAGGMGVTRGEEVAASSIGTGTRPVGVRNHACNIAPTLIAATSPSGARSHRRRDLAERARGEPCATRRSRTRCSPAAADAEPR